LGWAEGEIKCVGKQALRPYVFFTFPNGTEIIMMVLSISAMLFGATKWRIKTLMNCLVACCVIFVLEVMWHASRISDKRLRSPVKESTVMSATVRVLAAFLIMSQEATRFVRAISTSFSWVFWRVDWHFGQNPHWVKASKRNNAARALIYTSILYICIVGGFSDAIFGESMLHECKA
jgi:hypothetical protein